MAKKILVRSAQRDQTLEVAKSLGKPPPPVEWLVADTAGLNRAVAARTQLVCSLPLDQALLPMVLAEEEMELAKEADAIWTRRDNELLEAAPNCRWLQVGSAGVETVDMRLLIERDIELTNAAVIYGPQLADHNLALVRRCNSRAAQLLRHRCVDHYALPTATTRS